MASPQKMFRWNRITVSPELGGFDPNLSPCAEIGVFKVRTWAIYFSIASDACHLLALQPSYTC